MNTGCHLTLSLTPVSDFQLLKSHGERGEGNMLGNWFGRFLFGLFLIS